MSRNEENTKHHLITPKLKDAGWGDHEWQLHLEYPITAGRILWDGRSSRRASVLRADYLLRYSRSVAIAVVEAKAEAESHLEGSAQARDYAQKLGLWFAYSTNGHQIEFFDLKAGTQETVDSFHSPEELWQLYLRHSGIEQNKDFLPALTHDFYVEEQIGQRRTPRYYQEKAVRAAMEAVLKGKKRILITQATGTGKTFTSIQLVYKLFKSRLAKRILFIVDRNLLADQAFNDFNSAMDAGACYRLSPQDSTFSQARSVYFGIYQTLVGEADEDGTTGRPDRYKEFAPDFFDLIVIDEAHRGGANQQGSWFRLLEYFKSATQVGLTATPRRDESADTYNYFGNPVANYSLKDGIADGYLSPYVIKRVTSNIDALGYRPEHNEIRAVDGRLLPNEEYLTPDFERKLSIPQRTRAFAYHLLRHLFSTDPLGKTIVFCVDQQHAHDMAKFVNEAFQQYKDKYQFDYKDLYATRITGKDKDSNNKYPMLEKFADLESNSPIVVTTSKLLTTGIDVRTVKNVVIFRNVGSMVEFKQIIGRGTRTYDHIDKRREKLGFFILEYANFSTQLFNDPDWDDIPAAEIDEGSLPVDETDDSAESLTVAKPSKPPVAEKEATDSVDQQGLYVETDEERAENLRYRMSEEFLSGNIRMVAESVSFTGEDGKPLSPENYILYQSETFKKQFSDWTKFQELWCDSSRRKQFIETDADAKGLNLSALQHIFFERHKQRSVDLIDVVENLFFGKPRILTKAERIERAKNLNPALFDPTSTAASLISDLIAVYLDTDFQPFVTSKELWQTPRLRKHGTISDIGNRVGGQEKLRELMNEFQASLYDARIAA
jgi:type I restriction enzyme R subunit